MKKALRKALFKYKLHAEEELFEKAYGYIRQYYRLLTVVKRAPRYRLVGVLAILLWSSQRPNLRYLRGEGEDVHRPQFAIADCRLPAN